VRKSNVFDSGGRKALRHAAVVALCLLALGGCGKKPGHVEPPPSVVTDHFPRVYPDPATDPKPY